MAVRTIKTGVIPGFFVNSQWLWLSARIRASGDRRESKSDNTISLRPGAVYAGYRADTAYDHLNPIICQPVTKVQLRNDGIYVKKWLALRKPDSICGGLGGNNTIKPRKGGTAVAKRDQKQKEKQVNMEIADSISDIKNRNKMDESNLEIATEFPLEKQGNDKNGQQKQKKQ
jgi:hypothetical protein